MTKGKRPPRATDEWSYVYRPSDTPAVRLRELARLAECGPTSWVELCQPDPLPPELHPSSPHLRSFPTSCDQIKTGSESHPRTVEVGAR